MTKLSVNVNKIATLRNARGGNIPDVLEMALLIESLGADGITVHPRPDERHIRASDVHLLKKHLKVELNIEGYPSDKFIELVSQTKPAQVTLVPDPPHVLTSNAGFLMKRDFGLLKDVIPKIKNHTQQVSIFIDPKDYLDQDLSSIKDSGTDRVELYTERFANHKNNGNILAEYQKIAIKIQDLGLRLNAGHDLSLKNLDILLEAIPFIDEVSIGHALIADALVLGMPKTIEAYLAICHKNRV